MLKKGREVSLTCHVNATRAFTAAAVVTAVRATTRKYTPSEQTQANYCSSAQPSQFCRATTQKQRAQQQTTEKRATATTPAAFAPSSIRSENSDSGVVTRRGGRPLLAARPPALSHRSAKPTAATTTAATTTVTATAATAAAGARRKELAADDDVEIAEAVSGMGSGGLVRVALCRALEGAVGCAEIRRGNDLQRRKTITKKTRTKEKEEKLIDMKD